MTNNIQNQNQPSVNARSTQDEINDDMVQVQMQLRQVASSESGWTREMHKEIEKLREFADSDKILTEEGTAALELSMRNLGMPGIAYSGKALELLDKREEAILEERSLREQGKSYLSLNDNEKKETEYRTYNGIQFRNDWRRLYDFAQMNKLRFGGNQDSDAARGARKALQAIIQNEIRLAAIRDPSLGLNFNDNEKVKEITESIINDPEFTKMLNLEKPTSPNITNIKFEIIKRIKPENETERNLPVGD